MSATAIIVSVEAACLLVILLTAILLRRWPARRRISAVAFVVSLSLVAAGIGWQERSALFQSGASNVAGGSKHVIWWGSFSNADTLNAQMVNTLGQTFDGFVVQGIYGHNNGAQVGKTFAWDALDSHRHYSMSSSGDSIAPAAANLASLPTDVASDRFIRINTMPYGLSSGYGFDWTSDDYWNTVVGNVKAAAQLGAQAHMTGFFFDTENYEFENGKSDLYTYSRLAATDSRYQGSNAITYDQAMATAEQRGGQLVQAINQYMPNAQIIYSLGYTNVSQHVARANLSTASSSLLVGLLDGMLHQSTSTTTFIDGFELGYNHTNNPSYFATWANVIDGRNGQNYNMNFQKYPVQYRAQYKAGFGIDSSRSRDTDPTIGPSGVYAYCYAGSAPKQANVFYSPGRLAYTIQQAAQASDGYVWIWSNSQNYWLSPDSSAVGAPPRIYTDAIRAGAQHANNANLGALPANFSTMPTATGCQTPAAISLSLSLGNRSNAQGSVTVKAVNGSGATVATTTASSAVDGSLKLNDPAFTGKLDTFGTYSFVVKPTSYLPQTVSNASNIFTQPISLGSAFKPGDFNGDGKVGVDDLMTAIRAYNGTKDSSVTAAYPSSFNLSDLTTIIRSYNSQ